MGKRMIWVVAAAVAPLLALAAWLAQAAETNGGAPVLIDAVLYDGIVSGDLDEAVRLWNVSDAPVAIGGWELTDGEGTAVLPPHVTLAAGEAIWLTRSGAAFRQSFGFWPDFEMTDTSPDVPNLLGSWPLLNNGSGDQVILQNEGGIVDCMAYKGSYGGECGGGWQGALVQPYSGGSLFGEEGQILYRKRDQRSGLPVADTDTAADWAQDPADVINGRKVRYPGWDLDAFFFTAQITETAVLTVAIAPDNAYEALIDLIAGARQSIQIETLTFENVAIANALAAAAGRGVAVTVLLEGAPSGGLPDQEKYVCQQLEAAGGQCWFMIRDDAAGVRDRYRFLHAKFILVDGERVAIGSENLSPRSLPDDDKADGTWGRRGVILMTDAPGVVGYVQALFAADLDPHRFADLFRWQPAHPTYGAPPPGFTPLLETGGVTYTVRYSQPARLAGTFAFELVQAPENSLRDVDGLLGLINRAGAGDTILAQQLAERPYWGASSSNAAADPNPRLEAMIAAARRGATVRLLLDELFDDGGPTSNSSTCRYVNQVADTEGLDLACRLANPAGLGIHNKMVLAQIGGRGTVHVGSLNGTEQSHKGNRELAMQVQSDAAYALLAEMFHADWPKPVYLPLLFREYVGPAQHVLISEVLYDPRGPDDAEFIELVNPTGTAVDLSGYSLSDAVHPTDFEDLRRFPPGTTLSAQQALVVAITATGFEREFGKLPDFEIIPTHPGVPNMLDDAAWGDPAAILQLANGGDEVILRDPFDRVVDAVAYGSGSFPGVVSCNLVDGSHISLERFPYWRDTDDCGVDFRAWLFPNPGALP